MKTIHTRYCTFEVPDDWLPSPPFDFTGPARGGFLAVRANERLLETAMSAEGYAKRQKEILPAVYDELAWLQEGRHGSQGPGDGYSLSFDFRDDEGKALYAKAIYLSWGPVIGELLLLGPAEGSRERDRSLGSIEKSFALQPMDFLVKESPGPLLGELPAAGLSSAPPARKFPLACVALSPPQGWTATSDENGDVVLTRTGAEIRLRRSLEHGDRIDIWSRERLAQLRASGSLVLGIEQSQCSRGPYAALLFEEKALARTWKTPDAQQTLELLLADRQPLLWTLRAPKKSFPELRSELERTIATTRFLPSGEWETRMAEPWLETVLRGPWRPEGAGLYRRASETPLLLQVGHQEKGPPLEKIQSTCGTPTFRRAYGVETVRTASESRGLWKGREAFRLSLDGFSVGHVPVSVRAGWFLEDRLLYSVTVTGREPRSVDALHLELLEGLRFSARQSR